MKKLCILLCLLPTLALADWDGWGGSPVRRPAPAGGAVVTPYFSFGLAGNATNYPPIICGGTLTNADVTWTLADGVSTTTGTNPAFGYFTTAGVYFVTVSDWTQVTNISFGQGASVLRKFLTNISFSTLSPQLTRLKSVAFFYNASNIVYDITPLPVSVINLASAWSGCSESNSFPVVSNLLSVPSLASTWMNTSKFTGAYPEVNSMTNVSSLANAWRIVNGANVASAPYPAISNLIMVTTVANAWEGHQLYNSPFPELNMLTNLTSIQQAWYINRGFEGTFPDVFNLTNVTTFNAAWSQAYVCTGTFPVVSTLTNVTGAGAAGAWQLCKQMTNSPVVNTLTKATSLASTWNSCFLLTNSLPDITTLTNLTTCDSAFKSCFSLTGTVENLNGNLRKVTTYHDCFASCSNLVINIGSWDWTNNITDFDAYQSRACYTNRGTAGCFARGGPFSIKTNGFTFRMDNCMMSTGDLTQILVDFDSCGTSNMTINLGGTTAGISNLVAETAGAQAATNMRARACTVTLNGSI